MSRSIKQIRPLGMPWQTTDPFLFCVYHQDAYPAGNEALGPAASLAGRDIGQDFAGKDGWRMYHGDTVPGFPRQPHRGLLFDPPSKGYVAILGSGVDQSVQTLLLPRARAWKEYVPAGVRPEIRVAGMSRLMSKTVQVAGSVPATP